MGTGVIAEIPARAEIAVVSPGAERGIHFDYVIVLSLDRDLAPIAAIGTDGLRSFQHPRTIVVHRQPAGDGAHRTNLNAAAARVTLKFVAAPVRDLGQRTPSDGGQGARVHHFVAIPHAAHTRHAPIHLRLNDGTKVLFRKYALQFLEPADGGRVFVRKILQVTAAALIAHRAIQRMIAQQQFQHGFPRRFDVRRRGSHDHAVGHPSAARGLEFGNLFNLHQAHPAIRVGFQLRVVTEMRHHHAHAAGRLDHERAVRHLRPDSVNRHRQRCLRLRHGHDPFLRKAEHRDVFPFPVGVAGFRLVDQRLIFVTPIFQRTQHRCNLRVAERAHGPSADVFANVRERP